VGIPDSHQNGGIRRRWLLGEDCRLTRNIEALAAAHILAGHYVVFAHHIGTELREAGAIALIGTASELPLLGTNDPSHFVFRRLMAVGTIQRSRLLFLLFVKKIAFFHDSATVMRPTMNYCTISGFRCVVE
jgi:hypothetical protein